MVQRLDDARPEVGVEDAIAAARARGRARRVPVDEALERRSHGCQLAPVERASRRRKEAQRALAFGRAASEASEDELVERGAEGQAGQLAAGGEHLLGDQRVAAGALGDKQQGRGRRAFALDLGHELGEVESIERPELEP